MLLENFEYDLPKELIAQEPLQGRSDSRLLTVTREGRMTDKHVRDLQPCSNRGIFWCLTILGYSRPG